VTTLAHLITLLRDDAVRVAQQRKAFYSQPRPDRTPGGKRKRVVIDGEPEVCCSIAIGRTTPHLYEESDQF
jgi:hypothetical protein